MNSILRCLIIHSIGAPILCLLFEKVVDKKMMVMLRELWFSLLCCLLIDCAEVSSLRRSKVQFQFTIYIYRLHLILIAGTLELVYRVSSDIMYRV